MPPAHLLFLRHGIALERGTPGVSDWDRPLTDKGRKRLTSVLEILKSLDLPIEAILSSPLVRAYQTAEMARDHLGLSHDPEIEETLKPGGSLKDFLKRLQARGEQRVLITGHEPDFSLWMEDLLGCENWGSIVMKKAGLAHFSLDWRGARLEARLHFLMPPRLARALK